ncbi:uncharacterized protein CcaverHIS019_0201640 [Cutaneotrichosporon cavernicola]|uniref:Cation-transporting P-type ATPase N-terminal domain-containing protein n=1 Tax=Cutaneotrichosporon cavernicola TaxID=279322 RepID=A0AA48I9R1_9TREE|nr:uncharacterized protein CcaverHIS019_0201640 [Cutaneotrichosporon cavernicola]BEI88802.1 hypothetical protein CcaverHIS019_0201640 [Cutaneotrichosporon cavernicola]
MAHLKDPEKDDSDTLAAHEVDYKTIIQAVTIQDDETARELRLRRQASQVDAPARVVGEFRNLSIHVTDSLATPSAHAKNKAARELSELDWHRVSVDDALQRLNVSPKSGLDADQVKRRQAAGFNEMTPPPRNLLRKWLSYVFGGFGSVLFIGGVLCFIAWRPLGDPNPAVANLALAVILFLVILIQTAFNAWQDWSTSRIMASITNMLPQEVTVIRDSLPTKVPARELVSGDIVSIGLGNKLPADVRFLTCNEMKFDRSVLTGESEPISSTTEMTDENILESKNIGLQGTLCVAGSGTGVVFQTGDATVFGRIAKLSSRGGPRQTTLEKEIFGFVLIIVGFALSIAIFVIILWAAWLNKQHKGFITPATLVISVVSVCVAFIPEGLPVSITISLKVVANALARRKVLCKTLMTVETLGSVSVLCSDKTGTLTSNCMAVTHAAVLDDEMTHIEARDKMGTDERVAQLATIAGLCNGAQFESEGRVNGDATDSAILRFADSLRSVDATNSDWAEVYKAAFSSKTKFMLRLLRLSGSSSLSTPAPISKHDNWGKDSLMLTVKGAPDVLLKRCAYIATSSGVEALSATNLARLSAVQAKWSTQGQRVLLLAKRVIRSSDLGGYSLDSDDFANHMNANLNQDLTVIGLVGLVDPPREDIPETVRILRGAGIRFFMVTGDFALTAVAIAEQCGIVTSSAHIQTIANLDRNLDLASIAPYDPDDADRATRSLVLSGPDLMEMNDSQWAQACAYAEIVFARTTPDQKLRIVREFQSRECIVGMTGDGVNDAPSLKAANVGIAMGSGSDVAIEAADLVLLDTFSSMVTAVTYGRLVFDNLKKTILYLLPAGSFSELMPILLNVLIGVPQMLSSIQMIIICCLTDVLPAVSMCFEKPEAGLLTRRPRDTKKDKLVDWKLLLHAYGFLGVLESLAAMSMAFWYLQRRGYAFSHIALAFGGLPEDVDPIKFNEQVNVAQSVYFFTLVFMQFGNLLATRTRRLSFFQHPPWGETANWYILPAMAFSLVFLFFLSYPPFFQSALLTRGVPVEYIFIPITFGIGLLFLDEARKFCVRKWPKGFLAKIAW